MLNAYSEQHNVARAISQGDHWFDAWVRYGCTPYDTLARRTGIDKRRIIAIAAGDRISRAEVYCLAIAWAVSEADLIASIGDRAEIVA